MAQRQPSPRHFQIRNDFIPFSPPLIGEDEINEVIETLRTDWITTGPKVKKFEEQFKNAFGCEDTLAINSCTAGLQIALAALGVGPGDEVITVSHTFCATCNVIEHLGAKPVLIDVDPDTLCMDPNLIEAAITPRTKVIMPVHYAGHPFEMDQIQEIADRHGLQIVEDAAHPVSAKYKGNFIGSGKNPAAFSFYATKNMTTSEGGMLTGTPEFIAKARIYALHGMSKDAWKRYEKGGSWKYDVVVPGYKVNMTDIQASLGIHQLRKLPLFQARRREVVAQYQEAFAKMPEVQIPVELPHVESSWHLYVLRLNLEMLDIDRDQFIEELKARNVGTSVHYIPVHTHPYYVEKYGYEPMDLPVTYSNYMRMISLPLNAKISDEEVQYVINAVKDVVALTSRIRKAS